MALSETTRLGLIRWSSGLDPFNRDQMDESHELLEARVGIFLQGAIGSRPAASAAFERAFYLATDQNAPVGILYYCDGAAWRAINSFSTPSAQVPGDVIVEGTATTQARSDHKHSLPAWGIVGEIATVGTSASAGSADKFARVDHVHVLANGAVTAGKIAAGGVSAANQVTNGILVAAHFGAGQVDRAAIAEDQRQVIGGIMMFTGTTAPLGWLMCDGSSYATASYSALFAVIGYKYGGAGASFNVPDFRDRLPRGAATPSSTASLAIAAGADTVTIATTNLPSHTHGASGLTASGIGNHTHTWGNWTGSDNNTHYHGFGGTTSGHNVGHSHSGNSTGNASLLKRLSSYSFAMEGLSNVGAGAGLAVRWDDSTQTDSNDHSHTYSGNTSSQLGSHQHYASGTTSGAGGWTPSISGNTAAAGSGTALSVIPKSLTVNFIIKI